MGTHWWMAESLWASVFLLVQREYWRQSSRVSVRITWNHRCKEWALCLVLSNCLINYSCYYLWWLFLFLILCESLCLSTYLEKGMANHFSILALRTCEQYEKEKREDTERWTPRAGRCPICYWRSVEKSFQKEWRDGAKAKTTLSCGCDWWLKSSPML